MQTLTCPSDQTKVVYRDSVVTGFMVEVHRSGSKTYALKYRDPSGGQRQYKIANVADISFAEAKKEAIRVSDDAVAVLKSLPRYEGCPFVVPNPQTLRPITSFYHSWDTARRAAKLPDVRVHDLRHSMASNMATASGPSISSSPFFKHIGPEETCQLLSLSATFN